LKDWKDWGFERLRIWKIEEIGDLKDWGFERLERLKRLEFEDKLMISFSLSYLSQL